MPAAEDHRRKADEAAAEGHVLVKPPDRAEREPGAAEAGHHAGDNDMRVAGLDDIDAERVGGTRMLANRAGTKPVARMEQVVGRQGDEDKRAIDEQVLVEQHRPDQRDVAEDGDLEGAEGRCLVEPAELGEDLARDVGGQAENEQVDDDTGDDLVDPVGDHQRRQQQPENAACQHRADDACPAPHQRAEQRAGEGPGKKHALDGDIDHPDPFAQDSAKRRQRDRHGANKRRLEHACQRNGLAGRRPDKKRHGQHDKPDAKRQCRPAAAPLQEQAGSQKGQKHRGGDIEPLARHGEVADGPDIARPRNAEGRHRIPWRVEKEGDDKRQSDQHRA